MPDVLSAKFMALADPTRRAIMRRLMRGDASLTELAQPFDMSVPAIAKHLRMLERAGLIARGKRSSARPIRMNGKALSQMTDWIDDCRSYWEASFDRMAKALDEHE